MSESDDKSAVWDWIGRIGAQAALLTAALFYFGWARTNATYRYFGVDLSVLNFSTSDYVLRSVNSVFKPLLVLGLLAFAVALTDQAIAEDATGKLAAGVGRTLAFVGFSLLLAGVMVLVLAGDRLAAPVAFVAAFTILSVRGRWVTTAERHRTRQTVLTGLALITGFWALSLIRRQRRRRAREADGRRRPCAAARDGLCEPTA